MENYEDNGKKVEIRVSQLEVKLPEEVKEKPLWFKILLVLLKICFLLAALYGFLLGLSLLSDSFRVLTAKSASNLFSFVSNPIAGLMVGIIVTVLFQSSSTTTSIIVGLVGARVISVGHSVPIIMGANIGTSVTSTLVALGQIGSGQQFKRAFAGAVVHDSFNILNVLVFLPIEWIVMSANNQCGFLCWMCSEITSKMLGLSGAEFSSPLDKIIKPLEGEMIKVNKDVYQAYSYGCRVQSSFCSTNVTEVLDGCFDGKGKCILQEAWHKKYDSASIISKCWLKDSWNFNDVGAGIFLLILSLIILCGCLLLLVKVLQSLIMGQAEKYIQKALNMNGYLAILIGTGLTILLQSSSVITSILTPLVGVGVLELEGMFPLTLGANIGTTVTAILASLATNSSNSITTSLCHLFFNLFGTIIFYPIPYMRNIPMNIARWLGNTVYKFRWFALFYILSAFLIVPGYFLLVAELCTMGGGAMIGGIALLLFTALIFVIVFIWYVKYNGKKMFDACLLKGASKDYLNDLAAQDKTQIVVTADITKDVLVEATSTK